MAEQRGWTAGQAHSEAKASGVRANGKLRIRPKKVRVTDIG